MENKINNKTFYGNYHGHYDHDIIKLFLTAKDNGINQFVWFAGDSTLDNKYWLLDGQTRQATKIYKDVLQIPLMVPDVAYNLNTLLKENQLCINTAVEATTLQERRHNLLLQDIIIKENMTSDDVLVVSCGGNDLLFNQMTSVYELSRYILTGNMDYFYNIFHVELQRYINNLVSTTRPKMVIVCMLYYPNFKNPAGWASTLLTGLKYFGAEEAVKKLICRIYFDCVSKIKVYGTEVKFCPLFEVMNGIYPDDYVSGVEPSAKGGLKIAKYLNSLINK